MEYTEEQIKELCKQDVGLALRKDMDAFLRGAKAQKKIDIAKACEWMYDNFLNREYYWEGELSSGMFVEAFRKAMEK